MDESDIKRALRGYVTADPPPFGVTAAALVDEGRRRQLRRTGWVSLGSAGMAGFLAFAVPAVLAPRSGPDLLAPPGLNVTGCDQPLPLARWPLALKAKHDPLFTPSPDGSFHGPSQDPVPEISGYPSGVVVEATRWPSTAPEGPLPQDPDPAKIEAMACYVRGAAVILFPNASFAPASEPPMQVMRWPQLDLDTGWKPAYHVRAQVIDGQRAGMFAVQIHPLLPRASRTPSEPDDMEVRNLGNGRTAYFDRTHNAGYVHVNTQSSSIFVTFDGLLTIDQAIALAMAPELDLFS